MKGRAEEPNQRGAAAVEFALVAPLLFLLVFGIIEFGFIFHRWISITHGAREGVRHLAIGVEETQAETEGEEATGTLTPSDANPPPANSVTCDGTIDSANQEVEMTCYANYHLALYFFDNTIDLHSTARARQE